ncbi:MAG: hypothetical protein DWQ05_09225 [Calditrichaeota bacterium]|nr:MAG: hypothetical protein DWQ05_09225 [Calditrichota bacterium]
MMKLTAENLEYKLISQCWSGDGEAFARLIAKYKQQLLTFLWRMCGDKTQADDLFQETLVKAWRNMPNYDHRNKFAAWLFGIARNVAIDALRRKKIQARIQYTNELPEHTDFRDAASEIEAREMENHLLLAINSLPEKQREVFLLRQHSEMTFKEIARETKQPLNTVLGHMHYAVNKLKKAIRENDTL